MAVAAAETAVSTPTHPVYTLYAPVWRKLAHVYDGSGGFLDGTYLVPHPREWEDYTADAPTKATKKLKARRALARYENVAAVVIDAKKAALFRQPPIRVIGGKKRGEADHPLLEFWSNVDGYGCSIDDYMADAWIPSAVFGHTVHVMDRPESPSAPMTRADQGRPYLRMYAPLDMVDWLTNDRGYLTGVKLQEAVLRDTLDRADTSFQAANYRLLTETTWELRQNGQTGTPRVHGFQRLPVVLLYAKRRALVPIIGQSVLHDPQLFIDLYNLTSEIRELLRLQTFAILNCPLGSKDGDKASVQDAKDMLGMETGVNNVAFSPLPLQYIQPDTGNVEVYQKERQELLRTIYRLCAVPWESDSKDAEAEGSLKLKREDMNTILAAYADECEKAEYQFVELWFQAEYGESWRQEMDKAQVQIRYPDTFDVTPFEDILEQAAAGMAVGLPEMSPTFKLEQARRLVAKFLVDATPDVMKTIHDELKAAATTGPADLEQRIQSIVGRLQEAATVEGAAS